MSASTAEIKDNRRPRRVDVARLLRNDDGPTEARPAKSRVWLIGTVMAVAAAGIVGSQWLSSQRGESAGPQANGLLVYYTVQRDDMPITVRERGALASQHETKIACELETAYGQYGTRILTIVPNGAAVKKGDLLVEFDSAPLRDRLATQVVTCGQAQATQVQASVRLENQDTQNATTLAAAELRLEMAKMAQKMYEDGDGGAYHIALANLSAQILDAKNQIASALATQKIKANRRKGVELLFKMGYRGQGDLDEAARDDLQADSALAAATNALAAAVASRLKLELYEHPMKVLELKGAIETAERMRDQAKRDNAALMAQTAAAKAAADQALKTEQEKLVKYQEQLTKCKVYAPHDGMVVHSTDRTPWGRLVADGELVTERFKVLSLPDLASMQVKVSVHESVLDQVKVGLAAAVKIDAFAEAAYEGTVQSVAVMPTQDSSLSSDVKVYDVIVTIDEKVEHLKPGMTASAEIRVDNLRDVVSVPIQAIVQEGDQTWCYLAVDGGLEQRDIKPGAVNDARVQVLDGLAPGERVVLNPTAVIGGADAESQQQPAEPKPKKPQAAERATPGAAPASQPDPSGAPTP